MAPDTKDADPSGGSLAGVFAFSLFLFFAWCWGSITISYIVHAVCAGVMGTWYFGTSRKRTVRDALARACTLNLGSIVFAAFIVAIIKTLKYLADSMEESAKKDGNGGAACLYCCLSVMLRCVEAIVDYINHYAIIRVAIYGESFCTAGQRTWQLLKYRGLEMLINDDLSSLPLWLGMKLAYMFCFALMAIYFKCLNFWSVLDWSNIEEASSFSARTGTNSKGEPEYTTFYVRIMGGDRHGQLVWEDHSNAYLWTLIVCFVAPVITMQILTCIQSFVQTLYVCWADDPETMDNTHPEESAQLKHAAAKAHEGWQVRYDDYHEHNA